MKQTQFHAAHIMPMRHGFTSLEFMVAMVLLGVALAGLFPLMVMSSRGIESLELRYTAEGNKNGNWFSPIFRPNVTGAGIIPRQDYGTWYVIPSADPWAGKLGAVATFSRTTPAAASTVRIINDDDAGYTASGTWNNRSNADAFRGDYQRHAAQSPATSTAVWTFSDVAPGYYHVLATWPPIAALATNARYVVYDGIADAAPVTVTVNQSVAATSTVYAGWKVLATRNFTSADKKVKVVLSTNTAKPVAADGVRVVPVSTILSIDKSFNREEVTVRVKVGS